MHVVHNTELDGKEISNEKPASTQNRQVFELAGSKVSDAQMRRNLDDGRQEATPAREPSSNSSNRVSDESPPSPFVSTIGTTWAPEGRPVSEMVSPINPSYGGNRQ